MANEPLIVLSGGAALAYGLLLSPQPPSAMRTIVKVLAVAPLAAAAYLGGAPPLLALGLVLSAVGDAFLAGDPRRWLPFGLAAFLAAHILYVLVFLSAGGDAAALREPGSAFGTLLALSASGAMLVWLWPRLGRLRIPVVIYVAAIAAMVVTSLMLPGRYWPVMLGALAFFASDAILSADLFRGAKLAGSERITAWAIWGLYYAGQLGIALGFLR